MAPRRWSSPSGRMIDGSSATNYAFAMCTRPADHDEWRDLGLEGGASTTCSRSTRRSRPTGAAATRGSGVRQHGTRSPSQSGRSETRVPLAGAAGHRVTLPSLDPKAMPVIDLHLYSDLHDAKVVADGVRLARRLVAQTAFADLVVAE